MKTILVTSDLTYAPKNYEDVFRYVVTNSLDSIVGVVIIKTDKSLIFSKILFLYFCGCINMANTLLFNIFKILTKRVFLKKINIPFIFTSNINEKKTVKWINSIKPDLILNMRTRNIYQREVLQIPSLGCVNIHHGLLNHQRGLFCDLRALADNNETGFTIHQMTDVIDRGGIFYQNKIESNNNYILYLQKVALNEKRAIVEFIRNVAENKCFPKKIKYHGSSSVLTKTPSFKEIRIIQKKGIIL
jgi:methionyl-tRNA formyltransferase